jgi:hypothetical protein
MSSDENVEIPVTEELRDLSALAGLIRYGIELAGRHGLMETEHELRRALLGLQLEAPEAAALAISIRTARPN